MRIVKPYGRSKTVWNEGKTALIRQLDVGTQEGERLKSLPAFVQTHPELVIAQWISVIDKIIAKPQQKKNSGKNKEQPKPTQQQRESRKNLGDACWKMIIDNDRLKINEETQSLKELKKIWDAKISPYGLKNFDPEECDNNGKPIKKPWLEGRWYANFLGDRKLETLSPNEANALAQKIYNHLYVAERRIGARSSDAAVSTKRAGRIVGLAKSIESSVFKLPDADDENNGWAASDIKEYRIGGDVAVEIVKRLKEGSKAKPLHSAAEVLRFKYRKLFPPKPGTDALALRMDEVRGTDKEGLLNLHNAVRDCYSRLLKRTKKPQVLNDIQQKRGQKALADILPQDCDALFVMIGHKQDNQELNRLVRLGKIIHYESSRPANDPTPISPANDHTANNVNSWPDKSTVEQSDYRTSDGQARIKRNEALVRIWRHVLALAQRTLTDWADPENKINSDILLNAKTVIEDNHFDDASYILKVKQLFGDRANPFYKFSGSEFHKSVLKVALDHIYDLRNNAFHFKGLSGFVDAIKCLEPKSGKGSAVNVPDDVMQAVRKLWQQDKEGSIARLRDSMEAAHFGTFFSEEENRTLLSLFVEDGGNIPLPRFGRVIQRANEAWDQDLKFPKRPSSQDLLQSKERHCQYTALKLLYERPFKKCLEKMKPETVQLLVTGAVKRSTEAGNIINKNAVDSGQIVTARAARLENLDMEGEGYPIERFFFKLSEATATEMRVQRGYESDAVQAQKQAEYIEKLKCDVIALAFDGWLKWRGLELLQYDLQPINEPCNIKTLPLPSVDIACEDWQAVLYFVIHLVPVEEIGKLLHQLRKWEILAKPEKGGQDEAVKADVEKVQAVLSLYLAMHDAKYEGVEALVVPEEYREVLFEREEDFNSVFPTDTDPLAGKRLPIRGLREMLRFGGFRALSPIFTRHKITHQKVQEWLKFQQIMSDGETPIAKFQEEREALHKILVTQKRIKNEDLHRYEKVLANVIRYRHLSAHVTLTNHVRLHRLLMQVLGRLVDYSGLWERDLYFVTLALAYEWVPSGEVAKQVESDCKKEQKPFKPLEHIFKSGGLKALKNGQIISALDETKAFVKDDFPNKIFDIFEVGGVQVDCEKYSLRKIRNFFSHFNMLQQSVQEGDKELHEKMTYQQAPNLTGCVNCARDLMAYDRKLKNAVSQSVMELLEREGVHLSWQMTDAHLLANAELKPKQAQHLSKNYSDIYEDLHGEDYVKMVTGLFGANAKAVYKKENKKPLVNQSRTQNASLTLV